MCTQLSWHEQACAYPPAPLALGTRGAPVILSGFLKRARLMRWPEIVDLIRAPEFQRPDVSTIHRSHSSLTLSPFGNPNPVTGPVFAVISLNPSGGRRRSICLWRHPQ